MKINEVTEVQYDGSDYARKVITPLGQKMNRLGHGTGEHGSLKGMTDDELRRLDDLLKVGDVLASVGTSFGPHDPGKPLPGMQPKDSLAKMFAEVAKKAGVEVSKVKELIKFTQDAEDVKPKMAEPAKADEPEDDEFAAPADDDGAAADRAARLAAK